MIELIYSKCDHEFEYNNTTFEHDELIETLFCIWCGKKEEILIRKRDDMTEQQYELIRDMLSKNNRGRIVN